MKKAFKPALLDVKQTTIETWIQKLKALISDKEKQLLLQKEAEERRMQLIPFLKDAQTKGITLREMAEITGLSHATIGRWLNPEQYKRKPKRKKDYIEEAKELVAKAEKGELNA